MTRLREDVKITYKIEVLGTMWMGGTAAYSYTIPHDRIKLEGQDIFAGDLYLDPNLTELEAVESWLDRNTSDFQHIEAAHIVREEVASPEVTELDGGWMQITHRERSTVLRTFTEDDEDVWVQCHGG